MGVKLNAGHTCVQVSELCISEDVFASDNHSNNKIFLLSLETDSLLGSSCGFVSFTQVLKVDTQHNFSNFILC